MFIFSVPVWESHGTYVENEWAGRMSNKLMEG